MTDPTVTNGMQSEDRRTHIERLNPAFKGSTMTDAQFEELKALLRELLTPGYELSKLYLAQVQAQAGAANAARAQSPADGAIEGVATEAHG